MQEKSCAIVTVVLRRVSMGVGQGKTAGVAQTRRKVECPARVGQHAVLGTCQVSWFDGVKLGAVGGMGCVIAADADLNSSHSHHMQRQQAGSLTTPFCAPHQLALLLLRSATHPYSYTLYNPTIKRVQEIQTA